MNKQVSAISGRLSLRPPQRTSLEILSKVTESISLSKDRDLREALKIIRQSYPNVSDFERDFPSLCFALATGVGKTRLMGAFIAYLFITKGIKNFFVLAPNLTIYNKLIKDFTPGHSKYVFQGIAEFAGSPPEIITGDNYEGHRSTMMANLFGGARINIFNISKINSETRGAAGPRIKRLSEYIGDSYFNYLATLDDLVLVMDESHRYRASAGVKALNELNPILGLELTATPQVESGTKTIPFNNVIYSYPLASAMKDGFVKEPAVATRKDFDASKMAADELERLKLEDGIRLHENTKVELQTYAHQNDLPVVKPFMLVIAKDTDHANELMDTIKGGDFFGGRYKDRVITVHSNQKGEEKDETVERLLAVENKDEPTEIVIHVNMLKEGWDVTNLYTIVPLRTADSKTLVEQSIGRGLRLPYGKRVGVTAVDRLTIVAHDRFQDIIDEANRPGSILTMEKVFIDEYLPPQSKETIVVPSKLEQQFAAATTTTDSSQAPAAANQVSVPFKTEKELEVAQTVLQVIKKYERLSNSSELQTPEIQAEIAKEVEELLTPAQLSIEGTVPKPDISAVVEKAVSIFVERTIDIPKIVVQPTGDIKSGYHDFDMDVRDLRLQPPDQDILLQELRTGKRETMSISPVAMSETRLEDYLVRNLLNFSDIWYDDHADLLYKLAGQVVDQLKSYLPEEDVLKTVVAHQKMLADLIHTQMQKHYYHNATEFVVNVSKGFTTLRSNHYTALPGDTIPFRQPLDNKKSIKTLIFEGFSKCLYDKQKFDSDPERRFAMVLEDDPEVMKWFKPAKGQFQIHYSGDHDYEPDFVAETPTGKYMCEIKRADEVDSAVVQDKKRAAMAWCKNASDHELAHGGKPWHYLLIPHDAVSPNMSLKGLASVYSAFSPQLA